MADRDTPGNSLPLARHKECYVVPEMVCIAVLPTPERHGICPLLYVEMISSIFTSVKVGKKVNCIVICRYHKKGRKVTGEEKT